MPRTTLPTPPTAPVATGEVCDGIRWVFPFDSGAITPLSGAFATLGRDASCTPPLRSEEVSRTHARLERTAAGRRTIADLDSRNGVFVNGERVTRKELVTDDVVRLGDHVGVVGFFSSDARVYELESWEAGDQVLWCGSALKRTVATIVRLGESPLGDGVALEGEAGTGKTTLAYLFHDATQAAHRGGTSRPFVFVHGAAAGNVERSFAEAAGGTLFLSHVDRLPLAAQTALLRALVRSDRAPEEGRVRVISSTEKRLDSLVAAGALRLDVRMRIAKAVVRLPSLRQCRADVAPLACRFAEDAAREAGQTGGIDFEPKLIEALCLRPWPGNARELRNMMRGMIAARPQGEPLTRRAAARFAPDPPPHEEPRPPKNKGQSMRILFLAANPVATPMLDLEEELRALERELAAVRHRARISLIAKHAVRPDDLLVHVRRERPTVVHFSGHGSAEGIFLRDDREHYQAVSGAALQRFFFERGVELVVLNSCFSMGQVEAIAAAVPAVVGTTSALDDAAARRFSVAFYRTLGDGYSIGESFRDGSDSVVLNGLKDVFQSRGDLRRPLVSEESAAATP